MPPRSRTSGVYLTVAASLIWGTSFPGVKWGLEYAGNDVLFLWLRFLVASAVTLTVVILMKRISLSVFREPVIWLIGALNAGAFIGQYVGLNYTTASNAALLIDINVVAVAIISYFAFRERIGGVKAAGVAAGMVGVALITIESGLSFRESQLMGDLMVFLAGWGWAFFIVINKKILARRNAVELSSAIIAATTIWLVLPVAYLYGTGADFTVEALGWGGIVYLGIMCTSVATLLWAMGLEGVSATASATIMLLEVITALAIAAALLGETMGAAAIAGAALILAAIYLVSYKDKDARIMTATHG
jgi:drug/metabolite transporter (DMT)-like permease